MHRLNDLQLVSMADNIILILLLLRHIKVNFGMASHINFKYFSYSSIHEIILYILNYLLLNIIETFPCVPL